MTRRNAVAAAVLLAVVGTAGAGEHERARELREQGDILPLERILERVSTRHAGRVIEVELEEEDGAYRYELEVLGDDGVVREITVDARSGRIIREEED